MYKDIISQFNRYVNKNMAPRKILEAISLLFMYIYISQEIVY
jgi:hypothetical protein